VTELGVEKTTLLDGTSYTSVGHDLYHKLRHTDKQGEVINRYYKYEHRPDGYMVKYKYTAKLHKSHTSIDDMGLSDVICHEDSLELHHTGSDENFEKLRDKLVMGKLLSGGLHHMCKNADNEPSAINREVVHVKELEDKRRGNTRVIHVETVPKKWFEMFQHLSLEYIVRPDFEPHPEPDESGIYVNSTQDGKVIEALGYCQWKLLERYRTCKLWLDCPVLHKGLVYS